MSAHTGFGPRDRWRLRQNRLWILAALLVAATLYSFMGIIHDTAPRHVAATLVRKATAQRISAYAESRLTKLGLETFAARCNCPDTLPATEFFKLDLASGRLERKGKGLPADRALANVARVA